MSIFSRKASRKATATADTADTADYGRHTVFLSMDRSQVPFDSITFGSRREAERFAVKWMTDHRGSWASVTATL